LNLIRVMPAEGEMRAPPSELPTIAAEILERLRARRPRVHCITNAVAQNFTANLLLAAGALPSMTIAPREIRAFVGRADALLINLGTFDAEREKASLAAVAVANRRGIPWVLDPVFIDRSPSRARLARQLAALSPSALRLNPAEFGALASGKSDDAALARYAKARRTVVGLTGERDVIRDATRRVSVANGHPMMARVTAMGCAASALTAACLAVEKDAWRATASALILFGLAGEAAARRARGPGSFALEIIDAIYSLERDAVVAGARVS
jgi:hydroxyethylthiazole kinase